MGNKKFRREHMRSYGFWSSAVQENICNSKVSIGGAGGDGYQLAVKLAMMGVENFNIADPEVFEEENSNRVPGAKQSNMGKNKAICLAEEIRDMRPNAKVQVFTDGITPDNVEEFVHGSDLTIDETELTRPEIGTALAREARKSGIPNLLAMNIGFAAVATSFAPNSRHTFEHMMGLSDNEPLDEIAEKSVDFSRCLPYIPTYADVDTFTAVMEGSPLPSISQGVDIASAMGSTQAFLHLAGDADSRRKAPIWAPRFQYADIYTGKSGTVHFPRLGYYAGVLTMMTRSKLNLNPKADYPGAIEQLQR